MKTIIVDDEIKSIELLEYYLTDFFKDFKIKGKFTNIKEALEYIEKDKPNVIFLDINMPKGTGLDLLNLIQEKKIRTIFVTAHSEYAIDAIKLSAFDYLLKPINLKELKRIHLKLLKSSITTTEKIQNKKIEIKISSKHYIFNINEITHISSEGNYTTIHSLVTKPLMISKNLKKVEYIYFSNLPFFRCHQSHIININHVLEYSNYEIILLNNKKIPLSSKKYSDFLKIQKNEY